jgi:hypothetical protein
LFNDFEKGTEQTEGRGRAGVSLAASLLIFAVLAGGLGAAMATAKAVVSRRDRDLDVEFASLPEPEPEPEVEAPPPPPPPVRRRAASQRPAASQRDLGPPTEIPDEQPPEAEGDLIDPGEMGPVDGFLDGGGDEAESEPAPAPPPPAPSRPEPGQVREDTPRPSFLGGCRQPPIPEALFGQAATIRIRYRVLVGAEGEILGAWIVSGHELIPDETILECVRAQQFEPARLPDGTAFPMYYQSRFVIRPDSL